ncbi:DUF4157 domain-containing protein [Bradyrhizobium sp. U87765 SZCCT0131]|uniref:eCIS core domain-containing protein n=1 Tax=unclassified Bradyrhizobium TaxID=2631580 RepID=UPI001BA805EC|nr:MULTISPECIES: DUF4157 domain-containing protein [unclassified Bradyrhizobium]MBR1218542.1 DUF4157 domain-containing protein [Bradyrhizobium sp. U87765 SZCCT0131]MBR1260512.1 DUF4157 domain-containing protein [Bradyrhizobium sp. U87765 SZCCT0134]MBR1304040.1 DUF4157 domain-containing protein [Bradyrhizobium sp. U87765 SZCCT0110]MBR1319646.1 DUF4157 domain-containing protein [Bradyrhizobium sp. U87765 SZCCT0109]MBR1347971.1 DUF4157 domain-containing protein [Bradyrhizobium sp. U87765 SZCCT004
MFVQEQSVKAEMARGAADGDRSTGRRRAGVHGDRGNDLALRNLSSGSRERALLQLRRVLDSRAVIRGGIALQGALNTAGTAMRASARTVFGRAAGRKIPPAAAHSSGLPARLKAGVERLSGLSMDDVRVHYNSPQPATVQAHAYAQGTQIHLAPGQDKHLPHEAWHVVQQKQGRVKPTLQLKGLAVNDEAGLEREADVMGARALGHGDAVGAARRALFSQPGTAATLSVDGVAGQQASQHLTSGMILQRTKLNLDKDDKISGISDWVDRPSSNTTKQGQHLTAYVAFEDMILSHVRGCTVVEAAQALQAVIDGIRILPGAEHMHRTYADQFDERRAELGQVGRLRDPKEAKKEVERIIDDILSLRNKLPDTALSTSERTPGHGEAKSSGGLEVMENTLRKRTAFPESWGDEKAIADSLLSSMWRLLDYQPSTEASEQAFTKTKQRVLRHVMQMQLSYPRVSKWLTEHGYDLMAYLAKNRKEGMPLAALSGKEIAALSGHVAANRSDATDEKLADATTSTTSTTSTSTAAIDGPSHNTRSHSKPARKGDDMEL